MSALFCPLATTLVAGISEVASSVAGSVAGAVRFLGEAVTATTAPVELLIPVVSILATIVVGTVLAEDLKQIESSVIWTMNLVVVEA